MSQRNKNKRALTALTSAALAIPGLSSSVQAASLGAETLVQYKASAYREADLDSSQLSGGSAQRYEIDSQQVRAQLPLGDRTDASIELMYETMSGASPWFILPGQDGAVQVMSGATIHEERKDVQAKVNHLVNDKTVISILAGVSDENDYFAINAGLEALYEIPDTQLTLTAGLGYSDDELEPTDGDVMADRIRRANKDSTTAFVGISQILNKTTVVQASLSYSLNQGFLSDPYKKVWISDQANTFNDSRPDERHQFVAQGRLRHFLPDLKAAIHFDFRYFEDDWEIASSTTELAWYQNIADGWVLTPSLRHYSQTQAYFYAPYFFTARSDGFGSSDYRLSPYGAISLKLRLEKRWQHLDVHAEWERYEASADYSLESVDLENPALVEFDILSVGFNWRL
jgi:hypothetical protein